MKKFILGFLLLAIMVLSYAFTPITNSTYTRTVVRSNVTISTTDHFFLNSRIRGYTGTNNISQVKLTWHGRVYGWYKAENLHNFPITGYDGMWGATITSYVGGYPNGIQIGSSVYASTCGGVPLFSFDGVVDGAGNSGHTGLDPQGQGIELNVIQYVDPAPFIGVDSVLINTELQGYNYINNIVQSWGGIWTGDGITLTVEYLES